MKLHLPVALLTAVISAMSYGAEPAYIIDRTMGSEMQSGTYNDNDVIVNVTGGDFAKYNMGGDHTWRGEYGAIQGASETDVMPNDHKNIPTYGDIYLNVSDGENISFVIGEGVPTPVKVSGDKYINITGGDIDTIIGGVYYKSGTNGFTGVGNSTPILTKTGVADTAQWAHKDASNPDINISVTGGTVGSIRGGNSSNSANVYGALNYAKSLNDGTYDAMMSDKAWSVAGDVNISVGGNAVITGDSDGRAIMGGGGTGHSVDGAVNIDISGGTITGSVVAGTNNVYTEVDSTSVKISGGTIDGSVYAGGNYADGNLEAAKYANLSENVGPVVKNGTSIVLSGGKVTGDVYAAGIGDTVNGGTRVTISGDGTEVGGMIYGHGVASDNGIQSTVNGGSVLAIENSGGKNVNWDKIEGFNAVEFKGSQSYFGTLSKDFEKVSAENSHLVGKFEDGEVQLNATGSWLEISGNLTTTDGSSITNTDKPMTVGGDATFQGTEIENADLVAGGYMDFKGSSMNGGSISVGGKLALLNSDVKAQVATTDGSAVLVGSVLSDLTVDGSIKLADGSSFTGLNYDQIQPGILNKMSTVTADSIEIGNNLHSDYSSFTATEGGITIGSGASLEHSHLNAKGDITIEQATLYASDTPEGYTPYGSSEVTSSEGNISIGAGSTLTNTDLTAEKGSVNLTSSTMNGGNIVAGESVVINDSKVTSTTLTAGQNVSIADSTVSGSSVTATAGDLTVSGSELSNTGLNANNGTITIQNSSVTNSTSQNISGKNVQVVGSTLETLGGTFTIGGQQLVLDADSTVNAKAGNFNLSSDTVISNGATFETNGGHYQVYSDFIANAGTEITTNDGAMHFHGDVKATGTAITANASNGHIYTYGDVNLAGNSIVTADKGYVRFGNGNDVISAEKTTFIANNGQEIIFGNEGSNNKVVLNGDNELKAVEGTSGTIRFKNATEVVSNGTNTIDAVVAMADGTKITAESGTLNITTRNTSTLQNLQQTGDAAINVTAVGTYSYHNLYLKGTSKIESLTLNNITAQNSGSLTTSKLVSNGGAISNSGALTVKQTSQLTNINLTNTGTTNFSGAVTTENAQVVSTGGKITFSETVDSVGGAYHANGGDIWFDDRDNALNAEGGSFTVDKGVIRFGSQYADGKGVVNAAGASFVANKNSASDMSVMYFHSDVNATDGTSFTSNGGTMYFKGDVVAEGTEFVIGKGSTPMYFQGDSVELNGNNKFILDVENGASGAFRFEGVNITTNGNNTIDGNITMTTREMEVILRDENGNALRDENGRIQKEKVVLSSSLTAEGGVLNIVSHSEVKSDGSTGSNTGKLSLSNINIAENAAEGTEINVTANRGMVSISGESSISNLTVNRADGTIKGDVSIAGTLEVNNSEYGSMVIAETGALTAENAEINGSSLVNEGTANLKNVALTDGSSVSNTGETLELGAATVSGSVSIKHNTDGTTKIGGITKTDDSASVSLSQTGGTVEFNGGKGTVAEIDLYNSGVSDAAMVQSGDGTVNVGHVISSDGTVEFNQTGNGEMNFGGMWVNINTNYEINQTGKGHINYSAGAANVGSVTQSGGGTFTYDAPSSRILSLDISNGSTFEAMCSVELDDVAISDATLFNAGTMTMDSLVMDNATLLFAASALDSCSSFIFNGDGGLTGYGISNVSAADMIKEFGVVMSGPAAADLLQQWGSEVEFAFTLAQGSELFEKEFAYVLEQNLAEFTITLGDVAELTVGADEIKDLKVEDTENGVVISGIAVIPEPTTATLSLLALAALAARRRRR